MSKKLLAPLLLSSSALMVAPVWSKTYTVEELHPEDHTTSFGIAISPSDKLLIQARGMIRPAIDLTLIDFESDTVKNLFDDVEQVQNADSSDELSDDDYIILYNYVASISTAQSAQKIFRDHIFLDQQLIKGFDEINPNFDKLSSSTTTSAFSVNSQNWVAGFGSDAYRKLEYTNNDGNEVEYQIRNFTNRAFIEKPNEVIHVIAPESLLGGTSTIYDITDNGFVSGIASVKAADSAQEGIDRCEDDEQRGDVPLQVCLNTVARGYTLRGYVWQLDSQGNPIDGQGTELGILSEPLEGDEVGFSSSALAVNEEGIAVGYASRYYEDKTDDTRFTARYATLFKDGQVTQLTDPTDLELFRSTGSGRLVSAATDINNDDLVIGWGLKFVNGFERRRFFLYDVDNGEISYPDGFFPGSSTTAKSINNNGLVVGDAEIDNALNTTRRRHGFIYDTVDASFTDINDYLTCNSPYTIVEANDINDQGVIAATALINKAVIDINGNAVLDSDGNQTIIEQTVAVKLTPNPNGTPGCDGGGTDPQPPIERKGGSLTWLLVLGSAGLWARRRTA